MTSLHQFKTILKGSCLTVSREDVIYQAVKVWVRYHGSDADTAYDLLREVQWPLVIDIEGIAEDVQGLSQNGQWNAKCQKMLDKAREYHRMTSHQKLQFWSQEGKAFFLSLLDSEWQPLFIIKLSKWSYQIL